MIKLNRLKRWCLFDFGLSVYPTLVLTFFYGAYYANNIANNELIGTARWGLTISISSLLTSAILLFFLKYYKKESKNIGTRLFDFFFIVILLSSSALFCFDGQEYQYLPLIIIGLSFIAFEILNLFYNVTLHKVVPKSKVGFASNVGWAMGYLGGLISLGLFFTFKNFFKEGFVLLDDIYLLVGPFIALWLFTFCLPLILDFKKEQFIYKPIIVISDLIPKSFKVRNFIFSYFLFNNGVICIFIYASLYASILFNFSSSELIFLGIFINLSGFAGCLVFSFFEDKIGSRINIIISLTALIFLSIFLLLIHKKFLFWIIALLIGFFIGPIQASSRSYLSKNLIENNQLNLFTIYSILGNSCSILGPFLISLLIDQTSSLRVSFVLIPIYFILGLFLFLRNKN